jgi:L-lactate dehydrogenase complex protein LldE
MSAKRVSLFVTCIVDQVFPKIGLAMANVLERAGYAVDFPEAQTCCGQPAFNSGYPAEARQCALHFLDAFEKSEAIVVPSGSCTSMVSHHFMGLFGDDPSTRARVAKLAARVWEFSMFLTAVADLEDVGARMDGVATFHDGCHALRELGIKTAPRRLLQHVRGLELREMHPPEECCGFGGTFSIKFPELSGAMARNRVEAIVRTGAQAVISLDPSCLMQIQGALSRAGLKVQTLHLAEVLASR